MVGVVNNSGNPLLQLALAGSSGGYPLFGFDGDGLQAYLGAGGAPDNTGYGGQTSLGQNTWFVNISLDQTSGTAVLATAVFLKAAGLISPWKARRLLIFRRILVCLNPQSWGCLVWVLC